ncbi:MAG TPA: TonB-dependent receptor [Acidobacteriaceae bacterium]|nr:TonB-dependent receptor [Acidobacteriaceae bacterium]
MSAATYAQNLTGTIDGVVTDASGAVIPGAKVTLSNAATGVVARVVKTDKGGRYNAPSLLIGTYKVTVQAPGFETTVERVELDLDKSVPVDAVLKVGSVSTEVVVASGVNTGLDLEDAAQSTLIEQKEVTELPLNQRNFVQFIALQPGVNGGTGTITRGPLAVAGGNNTMSISVNGQGTSSNGYYLDGADFLNHDEDTMLGMFPSVDALQEINLLRNNYGAQYGGEGAAIFNLASKGGTSTFHGSAYYYFQNQLLNANGYFNNLAGNARIPFRYNDFGFTLGGPLFVPKLVSQRQSSTFFFVSGEILRSAQAATSSVGNDPTAQQRQGIFSTPVCIAYDAKGACSSSSTTVTNIDPAAKAWLNDVIDKTPLPNDPRNAQGLISSFDGIMNEGQIIGRLDHSFGQKLSVFVRFLNDPYNSIGPEGIGGNTNPIPGLATTSAQSGAQNTLLHATYVPTPRWVIEGGLSHMRAYENTHVIGLLNPANAPDFNVNLPYVNLTGKLPTVTIDGTKYNSAGPINRINPTNQAFLNVTHTMGKHTLLFGVNVERMKSSYTNLNNGNNGGFNFTAPSSVGNTQAVWNQSFADFLIGYTTSFSQSTFGTGEGYGADTYEAYVQDNYKPTENLTLNVGLRYSYYKDPTEWILNSDNFDPALYSAAQAATIDNTGYICLKAPCAGGGTPNAAYNPLNGIIIPGENSPFGRAMVSQPDLDFAPRFGFAWSPFASRSTAIRGGFGIYYKFPTIWGNSPSGNPPSISTINASNVSFENPGGTVAPSTTPPAIGALGVNYKVPYLESFVFDVQRQLPADIVLDVAYVGNAARHLALPIDLNEPLPGAYVTAGIAKAGGLTSGNSIKLNEIRPYRGYGAFSASMPIFSSNYNGLQVQFKQHLGTSLELGGAYTFSKNMGVSGVQSIYNMSADYGVLQRDNMFVAQAVYNIPFYKQQVGVLGHLLGGYELSGIVNLSAGGVLTATTSNQDPAGLGLLTSSTAATARPDRVGDPNNGPRTTKEWFDTSAFAFVPASQTRPGNESIGSIYGPGSKVVNIALMRNIRLYENLTMQLRVETYNTLNHTNLSNPNTSLNSSNFGVIANNGEARKMQIAAKLRF